MNGFDNIMMRFLLFILLVLLIPPSSKNNNNNNDEFGFVTGLEQEEEEDNNTSTTILGTFEIIDVVPHDGLAFTQGLELVENNGDNANYYYESTGKYNGKSTIRIVNLVDGVVIYQHRLPPEYWGEGLTYIPTKNRLLQLTWKSRIGFIYEGSTLNLINEFPINTTSNEGWGICYAASESSNNEATKSKKTNTADGSVLYVSDGTNYLHTWNSETFELLSKVSVKRRLPLATTITSTSNTFVENINELEYDKNTNTILANVWKQNYILRINPITGFVTHQYDLSELVHYTALIDDVDLDEDLDEEASHVGVLNGIAITNERNVVWVTGKYWNRMYKVRLISPSDDDDVGGDNNNNNENSGAEAAKESFFIITTKINFSYWIIMITYIIFVCSW